MKAGRVFAVALAVIFSVKGFFTVKSWCEVIGWEKTTAVVSFIGLPDGAVFGSYTDNAGVIHDHTDGETESYIDETGATHTAENSILYRDPFLGGNGHNDIEVHYGKSVDLLYSPETFETRSLSLMILDTAISCGGMAVSALLLVLTFRKRKINK